MNSFASNYINLSTFNFKLSSPSENIKELLCLIMIMSCFCGMGRHAFLLYRKTSLFYQVPTITIVTPGIVLQTTAFGNMYHLLNTIFYLMKNSCLVTKDLTKPTHIVTTP